MFYLSRTHLADNLSLPRYFLPLVFTVKIFASFALVWIFTNYYPERNKSDVFKYFDAGNVVYASLSENPLHYFQIITGIGGDSEALEIYYDKCDYWNSRFELFNDNKTIIRANALIRLLSYNSIHVHNLLFSLMGILGCIFLYQTISKYINKQKSIIYALILFLFPSLVFWTSSAMKEALLILGFGLYVRQLFRLFDNGVSTKNILLFLLSLFILLQIKYYVLVCLIVPTFYILFCRLKQSMNLFRYRALFYSSFTIILLASAFFADPVLSILLNKRNDFIQLAIDEGSGSLIHTVQYGGVFESVKIMFEGAVAVLFRPLLIEIKNVMYIIPALETLLFTFLALYISYKLIRKKNKITAVISGLPSFFLLVAVQLSLLIGFTVPVLGAIVRYRLPVYLSLFLAMIIIYNQSVLKEK